MATSIKKEIPWWVLPLTMIGVLVVYAVSYKVAPMLLAIAPTPPNLAEVLNALFAALAFGGVIAAIIMQKRELELQRRELDETQQLLEEQRIQMEAQVGMLQQQSFENTFFQMARLFQERHADVVQSMEHVYTDVAREYRSLRDERHDLDESLDTEVQRKTRTYALIQDAYLSVYSRWANELGPYFRMLYHIVRFVDESSTADKVRYVNIVRAQLSDIELRVIFYNGLTPLAERFAPLMEKYRLLKHLDPSTLIDAEHKLMYAPRTFAEADEQLWIAQRPRDD